MFELDVKSLLTNARGRDQGWWHVFAMELGTRDGKAQGWAQGKLGTREGPRQLKENRKK